MSTEQGAATSLWASVERRGIEPVGATERRGRAADLGWVWFAANIGVLSLVFGAVLSALGLDMWQAVVAVVVGCGGSFLLVGVVAVAGKWGGMPTLVLSRVAFGRAGNLGPAALNWLNILGWEVVTSVIAAWSLAALVGLAIPGGPSPAVDVLCLAAVVAASLVLGVLGHGAIVRFQRIATYAFGALTLVVLVLLVGRTNWHVVASTHAASFGALGAATSILAAGTGLSWVTIAADYSRYLPHTERARSIVWWVTAASALPTVVLVMVGYLLSSAVGGLASTLNPIRALGAGLPAWMAAPYLVAAVGGMLAETDLACYSSGLGLLALGVRVRRSRTVLIDAGVVLGAGLVIMVGRQGFLGPFESFLEVLADGLAAWAGVFVADMWLARRAVHRRAGRAGKRHVADGRAKASLADHYLSPPRMSFAGPLAWCAGTGLALATTVCPWFTGPLALGALKEASYGYAFGFAAAGGIFLLATWAARRRDPVLSVGVQASASRARPPVQVPPRRLVVVGSILVDILVYVDRLPDRGGDVFAGDRRISTGGGFNVLSAASRLGLPVAYAGRIGDGVFGRQVARDLESEGIPLLLGFTRGEDTGFDIGIVEASGERTFLTVPGVESRLDREDLALVELSRGDAVYLSGYDLLYPVAGAAIASWLAELSPEHLLVVDPGPLAAGQPGGRLRELLGRVDVLSANAREGALLAGVADPGEAASALSQLVAPGGTVVIRTGATGCQVATGGSKALSVPGWSATPLDTTGAGDVHVGAFVARLAAGDDVLAAARTANAAAAWSVERPGGASGPSTADLAAVLGIAADDLAGWSEARARARADLAGAVGSPPTRGQL
ncbi:MAG: PfkB family carbohydrate kinase [Acidimicrobiales bacterium]